MSKVTELEKALTTLFRKGTEVGYTETEIDEFLENIDYHALLQAVWNKAETVYRRAAEAAKASPGAVGKAAGAGSPCAGAVRHRPAGTVQAELERKAAGYAVCRGGRPNRLTALRKGLKQYGCISR